MLSLITRLIIAGLFMLNTVFCVSTVSANISVVNGLSHEYNTTAGNVLEGFIEIKNHGESLQYINIYKTDYSFNFEGDIFYRPVGDNPRSNGEWIELSTDYAPIEAGSLFTYKYKITVPEEELTGSYWSLIMIEAAPNPDTSANQNTVNIQTIVRYGIQIITQIENSGTSSLDFLNVQVVDEEGKNFLHIDVANDGEQYLKPYLKLELFDEVGRSTGAFISTHRKIFPTTSVRYKILIEGVDPGTYQAVLLAETGDEERVFGVNLTLKIP